MDSTVSPHPEFQLPNRREFLYYLGGAGLLLFTGGLGVGLSKYLNPLPRYGERSGIYKIDLKDIPEVNSAPKYFAEGRYWLVNTSQGLIVLDSWCTWRHNTLIKWVPTNYRYECPSCGSKFQIDGKWIEGAAKRGLDQFTLEVTTDEGTVTTPTDGSPVSIEGSRQIVVNSTGRIPGVARVPDKTEFTPPKDNSG